MVVPISTEPEWMRALRDVPAWLPEPDRRTVVVSPHPDDETLSAGGLIAHLTRRGVEVHVIAVTDGEHAYRLNTGLAERRIREQEEALLRLGVPDDRVHRLRFEDSGVSKDEHGLARAFEAMLLPGDLVIAPWERDFHPDHEACGRAAHQACAAVGATRLSSLFWTFHQGRPDLLAAESPLLFHIAPEDLKRKGEALAEHRSQLQPSADEPAILPENLLWPARMGFEVYLR